MMSKLATGAKLAGVALAVGLAKGLTEAVQEFTAFNDKMTQSLAIMNTTVEQQKAMEESALAVSRETRISAEQSAEAFFFLASAGLDAEQSISALPQVAKFAQAGMFDMATATDLATDAQSALGLTVDDAQHLQIDVSKVLKLEKNLISYFVIFQEPQQRMLKSLQNLIYQCLIRVVT